MRPFLCFALTVLAGSTAFYGQNPGFGDNSDAQSQQSTSPSNCADPTMASADCSQNQQQNSQVRSYGEMSPPAPNRLGTVTPENATESDWARLRQQQQLEELPPDLPTEFQKFVGETTGRYLPIFGADLFRQVPSTFAPSDQVAAPADYVIGPEDELRVRIWGQISFSGNLRVDRSGNIYLPQVGTVQVAGLRFSELDQHLRAAVARIYRNFDLSVDLGRIRSIQVYVAGQARRPGAYTVSALSSLVDALFTSGGPSPQGSLRHILLKRDGKTMTDFDLYALLIRGDKSNDVRLLPEDVIYIPPAGPQVAITGSIRVPAIYELRENETVGDLIDMAGKTTATASNARIAVERVSRHEQREVIQVDFNATGLATPLADGDIIRIDPILPAYDKVVTLRGNVANPGRFGWHPGMRLSDLIPDVDSLVSRDYWWKRSHLGLPSPEFEPGVTNLGEAQPSIQPGAGRQPMSVNQLQQPQQPPTTATMQASLTNALTPPKDESESSTGTAEGQGQSQSQSQSQNSTPIQAAAGNQSAGQTQSSNQRASNETLAEAQIQSTAGENFQELPRNRVTVPVNQIDWSYAVIERVDPASLKTSLIPFDLGKLVLGHDASLNYELQPGDTVTIFSQADIQQPIGSQVKYVELEGEFVHPGFYSVQPGETLRDVVLEAGGLTHAAYLYGSEFTRTSTRIMQQQRLDDYVRELTLDAERGTQALAMQGSSGSSSNTDMTATSRTLMQDMLTRLSQIRATGRIVLRFNPTSASVNDIPAINLENGDKFVVPYAPANVSVVGAVYDQNSYVFQNGRTLAYYLRLAGGANRNADWRHAFLVRADGSVVSHTDRGSAGFWKESFTEIKLNPGDTLVVPDKTLHPSTLRNVMDWTQMFSQLALGAAVIDVVK